MGAPFGFVDREDDVFKGRSHISFHHALIMAADEAHKEFPVADCTGSGDRVQEASPAGDGGVSTLFDQVAVWRRLLQT